MSNIKERFINKTAVEVLLSVFVVSISTLTLIILSTILFNNQWQCVIQPNIVAIAIFVLFIVLLKILTGSVIFGEIGFIYLAISLAYTVIPALKFLMLDLNIPLGFDTLNFSILSPTPEEIGAHFWRHVLFIFGVAAGYLFVRYKKPPKYEKQKIGNNISGKAIAILIAINVLCIIVLMTLSRPVITYIDYYTRFDHLPWMARKLVDLCEIFKSGGYFVILAMLFEKYRKNKIVIFLFVSAVCIYEITISRGSRIIAFITILAFFGFYHYRVKSIKIRKAVAILSIIAIAFMAIEIIRSQGYARNDSIIDTIKNKQNVVSEFEAVFITGFHLYDERTKGSIPGREWKMFFFDFLSVIPLIDHTTNNPKQWYARNYYPYSVVPPTTMGVIAESAIWGGELDLLVRSIFNGILFALLARWFQGRREKWWAIAIYIYCFAMCVMTLKYSVLYQLSQVIRVLLPPLVLAIAINRLQYAFKTKYKEENSICTQ